MRHSSEQCDDGNLSNYDGCNSTCFVEPNFVCFGGSVNSPDHCYCDLQITGAAFAGEWTRVEVTFNKPVKFSSLTEACASILPLSLYSLLGSGSSCSISSSETKVIIALGTNSSFTKDTKLAINPNTLSISTVMCESLAFEDVSIAPDPTIPLPIVKLNGPEFVSPCEDMVLSGEGSEPNADSFSGYDISWSVVDVAPYWEDKGTYINSLREYVSGIDSLNLTIPQSLIIENKQYTFALTITNYLGGTTSKTKEVTTDSATKPKLEWIGPTRQEFFVYQHIVVRILAVLRTCGHATTPFTSNDLKFTWALEGEDQPEIDSLTRTPQNLSYIEFFPYATTAGKTYNISVTAYVPSAPEISATSFTILDILHGPLVPFIKGGNRTVSSGQSFEIDGTLSYDGSYPVAWKNKDLGYMWTCEVIGKEGGKCKFRNGTIVEDYIRWLPKAKLFADDFVAPSTLQFKLGLRSDERYADTQVIIEILEENKNCTLKAPYVLPPLVNTLKVNADSKLVLRSIYENSTDTQNTSFLWECIDGPCSETKFLSPATELAASVHIPSTTAKNIAFRLNVTAPNCTPAYSTLKLGINSPPINGKLVVYPEVGYALSTKFFIQADYWTDPEGDLPLRYEFTAADNPKFLNPVPLSDQILTNSIKTMLWKPLGNSSTLYIRVRISDSLFAVTESVVKVEIYDHMDTNRYLNYLTYLSEVFDGLSTNNVEFYLRDVAILTKQINIVLENKKAYEYSRVADSAETGNPYYADCKRSCYNSGTCNFNSNLTMYSCSCPKGYAYTSSCLLSLDEYTAELGLRNKIMLSNFVI